MPFWSCTSTKKTYAFLLMKQGSYQLMSTVNEVTALARAGLITLKQQSLLGRTFTVHSGIKPKVFMVTLLGTHYDWIAECSGHWKALCVAQEVAHGLLPMLKKNDQNDDNLAITASTSGGSGTNISSATAASGTFTPAVHISGSSTPTAVMSSSSTTPNLKRKTAEHNGIVTQSDVLADTTIPKPMMRLKHRRERQGRERMEASIAFDDHLYDGSSQVFYLH